VRIGAPTVTADLTDPASLRVALDGIEQVFLYSIPHAMTGFITAALRVGVRHVVVLSSGSVLLPDAATNPIAKEHQAVEEALASSGLAYTPIRPLVLAANALHWAPSILRGAPVRLVYPDAMTAPIHERDVAAAAVAALRGHSVPAVTEVLTGPTPMTQRQQVHIIAEALDRPIQVQEIPVDQWLEDAAPYMGHDVASGTADLLAAARSTPVCTSAMARILDRPPAEFAEWVHDHITDFDQQP
jgi:uncharacterized protein YbjT (DUF2867 family)